jgi:hypothetical protein
MALIGRATFGSSDYMKMDGQAQLREILTTHIFECSDQHR